MTERETAESTITADPVVERLQKRLKALMVAEGIKAAPLARAAELNEVAVRDILRGRSKNPGIVTLAKIASVLRVPTNDLFEDQPPLRVCGLVNELSEIERGDEVEILPRLPTSTFSISLLNERTELFRVATDRLEPFAFEGDVLVSENIAIPPENLLGRPGIVQISQKAYVNIPVFFKSSDKIVLQSIDGRSRNIERLQDAFVRSISAVLPAG
ncbi:MAG: helix-turn-helix transcriptional regulator [Rhodobacteraceae bacterium]|nr:helix-turn-helix transcriptional regulator [Paracoccaceae bacterium]